MAPKADIFVDTGGWGHLLDRREAYHALASSIYQLARRRRRKLITTNYIIAELVALMISPLQIPRAAGIKFIDDLKASPQVEVVHIDAGRDERAWQLLKQREDKAWSLVDCSSFVVMQELSITEALTADHHFEQ